jgi:hypothetical protein
MRLQGHSMPRISATFRHFATNNAVAPAPATRLLPRLQCKTIFLAARSGVGQIELEIVKNGARERIKTALLAPDRRQQFNKTKQPGVGRVR